MAAGAETAQSEFDRIYITSTEICEQLNLSRTALLHGRRRGRLPDAITLGTGELRATVFIWKREAIAEHIKAWKHSLQVRRGELVEV